MAESTGGARPYATVTPYLMVRDARRLLDFATTVFGAETIRVTERDDGRLGHSEFRIGESILMLSDADADWPAMAGAFYVYVDDVDQTYQRALDAGATSVMEPADQEYGDRHGGVTDPCGVQWWMAAPIPARP